MFTAGEQWVLDFASLLRDLTNAEAEIQRGFAFERRDDYSSLKRRLARLVADATEEMPENRTND